MRQKFNFIGDSVRAGALRLRPDGELRHWTERLPYLESYARNNRVLQLGVGNGPRLGVGVDIVEAVRPDVVADMANTLPFSDDAFDAVYAFSVLEHVSKIFHLMSEIHRVTRLGGFLAVLVPHFASESASIDPTHVVRFGVATFDYLFDGTPLSERFGHYTGGRQYTMTRRLVMLAPPLGTCYLLQRWVNRRADIYDQHLCYILRPSGIYFELEVAGASAVGGG